MSTPAFPERTAQTTTTTGTGTLTLGAAITGHQALVVAHNTRLLDYVIEASDGAWEVVRDGVYTHTGTLLTRGTFVASSTGTALVLVAGTHTVRVGPIGDRAKTWEGQSYPYPKRPSAKVVFNSSGTDLQEAGVSSVVASRIYFLPLALPRMVALTGLTAAVIFASAGTVSIGIYSNAVTAGNDAPGNLLAGTAALDTGTTGDKTGTISLTLLSGVLYWSAIICSGTPALRDLPAPARMATLGRSPGVIEAVSALFVAGTGSTLPATAPAVAEATLGLCPAIYMVE